MKEANGRDLIVGGDVLPRPDDFEGVEEHRERLAEDVDADLRGLAMRIAASRKSQIVDRAAPVVDETRPNLEDSVMKVVEHAARHEHELRSKGAAVLRIESKVYRPMNIALLKLQTNGVDTSKAYPNRHTIMVQDKSDEEEIEREKDWRERQFND